MFSKIERGWSVEGKDGFWYFLSKPQQMIARKGSYPSAPLLLPIIIIITTINHIDKIIIITINYVSIIIITSLNANEQGDPMGLYISSIFWC